MTNDDAQRDMEQRALRNVRALVDKIEATEDNDRAAIRRTTVKVVAGMLIVGVVVVVAIWLVPAARNAATGEAPANRHIVLPPPSAPAKK